MNNLILALLLLSTAIVAYWNRLAAWQTARHDVRTLSSQLSTYANALRSERVNATELDQRLRERRDKVAAAQSDLVQASAHARELTETTDASSEGAWPSGRDYFYLPKQFLGALGYSVFHNDGGLSEEAARLFGLTPAEKVALADSWRQLRLRLEQIQLDHAEPLDPSRPDSNDHLEVAFHLPALTNDVSQIRQQYQQDMEKQLGPTRSQLLWEKVAGERPLSGYPFDHQEQVITFSADRQPDGSVQHKLQFTNASRGTAYSLPVSFDPGSTPSPSASEVMTTSGLSSESALWN
jgi:hypothetical protein